MPATAWERSRRADVICSGVKTTGGVSDVVAAAVENGPEADVVAPAVVTGGAAVEVGKGRDMIDPETFDTKLVESAILPGLGRRL